MRKLLSAVVVFLWALPSFAAALPDVAAGPLDMAGAAAIALEKNSDLAALREELAGNRSAAELSGSLSNPVLELEGATGALSKSPDEKSIGIALSQEIPLQPVGKRRKELARAEVAVIEARLRDQERVLADQARRAWLDAALAARREELIRGQQAVAAELLEAARARFQAGDLAEFEVQLAEIDLRRTGLRQIEAVAAIEGARRRLALVLGLNGAADLPPLAEIPAPSADLPGEAELLAAALVDLGVKKGQPVGVFMPNSVQFVMAFYAILKAGGIVVATNPLYTAREIEHQANDAGIGLMDDEHIAWCLQGVLGLPFRDDQLPFDAEPAADDSAEQNQDDPNVSQDERDVAPLPRIALQCCDGQIQRQERQQTLEPPGLIDEPMDGGRPEARLVDRPPRQYGGDGDEQRRRHRQGS